MGTELPPTPPISEARNVGRDDGGHLDDETLALLSEVDLTSDDIRMFAAELVADDPQIDDRWREAALLLSLEHLSGCDRCSKRRTELSARSAAVLATTPSAVAINPSVEDRAIDAALAVFAAEHPELDATTSSVPTKPVSRWRRVTRAGGVGAASGARDGTSASGSGGVLALARQKWVIAGAVLAIGAVLVALRPGNVAEVGAPPPLADTTSVVTEPVVAETEAAAFETVAAAEAAEAAETEASDEFKGDEVLADAAPPVAAAAPPATTVREPSPTTTATQERSAAGSGGSASEEEEAAAAAADNDAVSPTTNSRTQQPAKKSRPPETPATTAAAAAQPAAAAAVPQPAGTSAAVTAAPSAAQRLGDAPDADTLMTRFETQTALSASVAPSGSPAAAVASNDVSTTDAPASVTTSSLAAPTSTAAPAAPGSQTATSVPSSTIVSAFVACPLGPNERIVAAATASIAGTPVGIRRLRAIETPGRGAPDTIEVFDLTTCAVLHRRSAAN